MNGIVQDEPAVNQWWSRTRQTVLYTPVPKLSEDHLSAVEEEETWLRHNCFFQSELLWLLSLEHHRFWSQVIFNPGTMDGLTSFLQEALPYYVLPEYLVNTRLEESYHRSAELVFQVFMRLGTFDPKAHHYFPEERQAELVYDHYIFTLPILLDLCHLFGRENHAVISNMVSTLFHKQPRYLSDLSQVVSFVGEVLRNLTHTFCGASSVNCHSVEPKRLSMTNDRMSLKELSPYQCRDRLIYLLDTVATTAAFLDLYPPACCKFRIKNFHQRLAVFYNEAVPCLEKKIESVGVMEEDVSLYVDLRHKFGLAKMEMLHLFKFVSSSLVSLLLEKRDSLCDEEVKTYVDEYMTILTDCLAEHTFIRDFHNVFGVDGDLDTLSQISPDIDAIKYNYIMESVMSSYPLQRKSKASGSCFKSNVPGLSLNNLCQEPPEPSTSEPNTNVDLPNKPSGIELESLITEVKDILPDLGDGFVLRCLEHYDYHSDAVINALLEDSLPVQLRNVDRNLPHLVEEKNDSPKRLNVFDNDEFDIMTRDHVDTSKIHKGKRRTVPKNSFELLNDKSELKGLKEMYHRFGSIDTTGSLYDDEYDDTYDDDVAIDEAGAEDERRNFVIPRVLRIREKFSDVEESDEEEVVTETSENAFCQNPADIRAKRERQREEMFARRGGGFSQRKTQNGNGQGPSRREAPDVKGNPKGQGQDKNVLINRNRKNAHKDSRANHNRRSGAQHKRNQGMIPS